MNGIACNTDVTLICNFKLKSSEMSNAMLAMYVTGHYFQNNKRICDEYG